MAYQEMIKRKSTRNLSIKNYPKGKKGKILSQEIIEYLTNNGPSTLNSLAKFCCVSEYELYFYLGQLSIMNKIEKIPSVWRLKEKEIRT